METPSLTRGRPCTLDAASATSPWSARGCRCLEHHLRTCILGEEFLCERPDRATGTTGARPAKGRIMPESAYWFVVPRRHVAPGPRKRRPRCSNPSATPTAERGPSCGDAPELADQRPRSSSAVIHPGLATSSRSARGRRCLEHHLRIRIPTRNFSGVHPVGSRAASASTGADETPGDRPKPKERTDGRIRCWRRRGYGRAARSERHLIAAVSTNNTNAESRRLPARVR
jgi:hypothetical protein